MSADKINKLDEKQKIAISNLSNEFMSKIDHLDSKISNLTKMIISTEMNVKHIFVCDIQFLKYYFNFILRKLWLLKIKQHLNNYKIW